MATVRFNPVVKDTLFSNIIAAIDAGAAPGAIKIYTGTMPADPSVSITSQTLLATLPFSYPCGVVTSHTLSMSSITTDAQADNDGAATWARITDSNGNAIMDVDVSTTTGPGSIKLNTTLIVKDGPVSITAFVMTLP